MSASHPLHTFFEPKSVAVYGATVTKEGEPMKLGHALLENLINAGYAGRIYAINPSKPEVLGIKAYPNAKALPEVPELAVITTPAKTIPDIISECAELGVPSVLIISAGFKEVGEEGAKLEQEIIRRKSPNMRIVGPNCLGIMSPSSKLDVTFATRLALDSNVAFVSQSGALLTAILDWSIKERVGFSRFVSMGSMLDVDWADMLLYLGTDPKTDVILLYMETIGDARRFMSAAREVSLNKPIFAIKPGRTQEAAKAAASHTGSLAGDDAVLDEVLRRAGVLRVDTIAEVFYMAQLAKQPLPRGNRLTMITNAGGPGVLATDALISAGGKLAVIPPPLLEELNQVLPATWSHNNPIDVIGDAPPERYAKAIEIALGNPDSDGILVILTPQAKQMTRPDRVAEEVVKAVKGAAIPVMASWMGGVAVEKGREFLAEADIPVFPYPDTAAKMFVNAWKRSKILAALYETPRQVEGLDRQTPEPEASHSLLASIRASRRTILTETEAKEVLRAHGIPVTRIVIATTEDEAVASSRQIGYPVVLKLHSETITHKSDVGGVELNLKNEAEVRAAFARIKSKVSEQAGEEHFGGVTVQPMVTAKGYELLIGSMTDPQIGPVIMFGFGGVLVEVMQDTAIGIPPLTTALARQMIERTKIVKALKGVRGQKPVNLEELEDILVKFSWFVHHHPEVQEVDLNPVLASSEGIIALDARIILCELDAELPKPAFRPYPLDYSWCATSKNGDRITYRPIRPDDEPKIAKFHEALSPETVLMRYGNMRKLETRRAHLPLASRCSVDFERAMALVAETEDEKIVGVGRLFRLDNPQEAEVSCVVCDSYQRRGIGTELLRGIIRWAKKEGITKVIGYIRADNTKMINLMRREGFTVRLARHDDVVAELQVA